MSKKIGVLGGMGPMASQLFYKMVTEMTYAECDQDHVNMIICSDTSMPDRTGAILSGQLEEVHDKMLANAKMLEGCGCQAVAITCNTAHYFADMIANDLGIPIIHMIKETVEKLTESDPGGKIAILATDGTIQTGIYQKRMEEAGLRPYVPEPELQKIVMYQIYDCIKAGKAYDAEQWKYLDEAVRSAGCTHAIMGCTELSVIKSDEGLGEFYVDPMKVLAEKVIRFSGREMKR
ncbi:aspartate/glutamate racemase family protein [Ihubacter sp. rT4E-8]|uniref:aspartate/glutamate racemase family protein n=1 Tax=unclassified Ihubacter TaxID=2633299 RepID=UPI003C79D46D